MADTTRRVFCKTCKKEIDIQEAYPYNTGRRITYECRECRRTGVSKADGFHVDVCMKMRKEREE